MDVGSRADAERLDDAVRALCRIEAIANAVIEKEKWDSDLYYVLDAIGDIARGALDVAAEREPAGQCAGGCDACAMDLPDVGDGADEKPRRAN
ncbi:MAG: hypothetical protein QME96_07990 [Myxococcota bacterium]|nr:hypothetical protein [Myxococcota bacterium]